MLVQQTMSFSVRVFILLLLACLVILSTSTLNSATPSVRTLKQMKVKRKQLSSAAELLLTNAVVPSVSSEDSQQPFYMKFFPIYPKELVKFFSLSFMMFWIVFVFTMTRDTKDALIVTNCGAESISFLKVYGVIPAAAAFMVGYSTIAKVLSPSALFYAILLPFFAFYAIFAFVLYPLRDILHPIHWVVPQGGLSYAVNLLRYWTYSLYYIVSELWGSAGVPLLFWSCANDVVLIDQAKRMYPLMSLIGNLGPILSGATMAAVSSFVAARVHGDELAFETSLKVLTGLMTLAGLVVAGLHHFIRGISAREVRELEQVGPPLSSSSAERERERERERTPEQEPRRRQRRCQSSSDGKAGHGTHRKPSSPSLVQSLRVLASSSYLLNMATMVLCYGLAIEFTEILWKASVKAALPEKTEYLRFMGRYSTLVGSAAFVMMLAGAKIARGLGWRAGALTTPLLMGLSAAPFFGAVAFGDLKQPPALLTAVYVGLVQNVLSKAAKYAIFDPTKEIAYIPLDAESKTSGKAAIDVLGARLGKSGGALSQQALVLLSGSIFACAPSLSALFYIAIALWARAAMRLAPEFEQKTKEYEAKLH